MAKYDWIQRNGSGPYLNNHLKLSHLFIKSLHYLEDNNIGIHKSTVILIHTCITIVTIVPIFAGTCDLESLVASGHKKIWRPPAANMGFCDFKDVVAFGNNQL